MTEEELRQFNEKKPEQDKQWKALWKRLFKSTDGLEVRRDVRRLGG